MIRTTAYDAAQVTKHEAVAEVASVADSCSLQAMRVICSSFRVFAVYSLSSPAEHISRTRSVSLTVEECRVELVDT